MQQLDTPGGHLLILLLLLVAGIVGHVCKEPNSDQLALTAGSLLLYRMNPGGSK